jgi:hypothetical protein
MAPPLPEGLSYETLFYFKEGTAKFKVLHLYYMMHQLRE